LFRDGQLQRTGRSLNPVHPTARTCKNVKIAIENDRFRFFLTYGWPDEESTSCWPHLLAWTEGSEPFLATLARAVAALAELVHERAEAA
jgi:hypothetical protein